MTSSLPDMVAGVAHRAAGPHIGPMLPRGRFWTIPNGLSLSRLLLLPLFVYAISDPELLWLAGVLVAYGMISDLLDGYLARRLDQVSEWGKVLDPLADKLAVAVALLYCYFARGLPFWILALALGRDAAILLAAPWLARRAGRLPPSNMPGRLAALSLALLAMVYLLEVRPLQLPTLAVAATMVFISGTVYARRFWTHAD